MKVIRNINELDTALNPILKRLANEMAKRVYGTLNYFLNEYYTGWTPESYRRTKDFLYSAVKLDAKPCKGGFKAEVYVDYELMDNYVNETGSRKGNLSNLFSGHSIWGSDRSLSNKKVCLGCTGAKY